jgi:ferritin-like metal-binding protein YciE
MTDTGTLHDAFIDELRDTYDAEKQLSKALPKLAKAARSPELRSAFEAHLEETRGQIERLEAVFESIEEKARGKHCDGIAGIIEEGKSVMGEEFDDATMDACLIAAGQRAEHYEIAAYGTLVAWARAMGHSEAADMLQETLDEEKAADEKLTALAESGINQEAADAAHAGADEADEDEDGEDDETDDEEDDEDADEETEELGPGSGSKSAGARRGGAAPSKPGAGAAGASRRGSSR